MIGRKAELRKKIDEVIIRLQMIQHNIAGTRQPASKFELDELQELGRRYGELDGELKAFINAAPIKKK
ncbi:MAG: hypothetical protein V3V12_04185 [Gammaproteobacteria bacterium]